jgi:hypothetical protein
MDSEAGSSLARAHSDAPSPPSAASWSPALRPEKEEPRAISAKPLSQLQPESSSEEEVSEDEDEEDDSEAEEGSAAPAHIRTLDGAHNTQDDSAGHGGHSGTLQAASQLPSHTGQEHGVNGTDESELVNATQGLQINEPPATTGHSSEEEDSEEESEDESSDEEPVPAEGLAEHYEHQGEATALEEAVNESVEVPLVADAAPETDDWGGSDDAFELGGQPQATPFETPHAEAVGTTVGDDIIGNTRVGGNAGDNLDWGQPEGEEDFFGGGVSQTVEPATLSEQSPGAHVVQSPGAKPAKNEWDLDLDLDDEFLPDEQDAPILDLSDDEGFLEDEPLAPVQQPTPPARTSSRYAPQSTQPAPASTPGASPYAPQGQFSSLPPDNLQRSMTSPNVAYNGYGQNLALQQQQSTRPVMPSSAQSFADKAKGGYASPYDMPDDIVTTRKRPAPRASIPAAQPTPPPPRISGVPSSIAPPRPMIASTMSASSLSPPSSGHSMQPQMTGLPLNVPSQPTAPVKTASSDFFAELPVTSKPKPSGRYTPQPSMPAQSPSLQSPPQLPPKERTSSWSNLRNEVLPNPVGAQAHLRQPEQLPMFPTQPSVPTRQNSLPTPPMAPARYSPAPPTAQGTVNSRYSPTPPGSQGPNHARYVSEPPTGPPRPPSQNYTPRTSSPLVHHSVSQPQELSASAPEPHVQQYPGHHVSQSADGVLRGPFRSPLEGVSEDGEQGAVPHSRPPMTARSETPPSQSTASSIVGSPRKKGNYTPQYQPSHTSAPSRSLSQSPGASMKHSAAAYGGMPMNASYGAQMPMSRSANSIPHRRQASLVYDYIVPEDERAGDELQRWKGHPVFNWGVGGTIVTSFPKQIPRYGGGMTAPKMKCSPGEIRVQSVKDVFPLPEDIARFPGPLRAKGKKKDLLAWLTKKVETLEHQLGEPALEHSVHQDEMKRFEDKALLLKLLLFLVENDGRLEGDAAIAAVKKLFSPPGEVPSEMEGSFSTAADIVGRSRSNTSNLQAEPVDPRTIKDLQTMLAKGEREKAVWHAVDKRLWGHAMLLSSTLNKDIWKQVVQEFVRKEVKKIGRSNQALAVLYEVFAGNHEDCVDELVPASARAGFQMVSSDGVGAAQNAQQGLDKWRETVALILNNRSEGDVSALLSLGRLLAQYGRVEAAHICFIFARSVAHIGGVDDAQSDLVLIGFDHKQNPLDLGIDLEPILLTEVYEFALSLSAQNGAHIMPHLQNYKLIHAYHLAEYGYRTEAQAYGDAITATMKATTRMSPYYNAAFISTLDDFSKRISQSPKDSSSSWISKPSMDRVSTSLLSKFNSFIAGDDEDAASNKGGGAVVGPFANIAGNSPSITPSQSSADLYGPYAGFGGPAQPPAASGSRYAPSNTYSPRTSSEQQRSRLEPQGRPSMESINSQRSVSDNYMPMTPMTPSMGPYSPQPQLSPPSQRSQAKNQSYSPLRAEQNTSQFAYGSPYLPVPSQEQSGSSPTFDEHHAPQASFDEPRFSTGDDRSFGGYGPPSSSFEPAPYQPYNPNDDEDKEEEQPKKKSFMDDDNDDIAARAATLKSNSISKTDADRKADEAFRKAAEADAQRDKDNGGAKKAGWFGGWFKKDPNAPPGPIKAKLGEESSFYYDPDLGKWVNKKGGASEDTVRPAATPPPPKGPPMGIRSASGGTTSSLGPPTSAGLMRPPTSAPMRSSSMPPPMGAPGSRASTPGMPSDTEGLPEGPKPPLLARPSFGAASGPPSRPGTGMSNASSIEDLIGAPQARKGPGAKKKKAGRYVDVFPQGQVS